MPNHPHQSRRLCQSLRLSPLFHPKLPDHRWPPNRQNRFFLRCSSRHLRRLFPLNLLLPRTRCDRRCPKRRPLWFDLQNRRSRAHSRRCLKPRFRLRRELPRSAQRRRSKPGCRPRRELPRSAQRRRWFARLPLRCRPGHRYLPSRDCPQPSRRRCRTRHLRHHPRHSVHLPLLGVCCCSSHCTRMSKLPLVTTGTSSA